MKTNHTSATNNYFNWTVIGAGPAGIATVGLLIDQGINPEEILWLDPFFQAGDLGRFWGAVSSNTSVALFHEFLNGVKSFCYPQRKKDFTLDQLNKEGFCELRHVAKPLTWITQQLCQQVNAIKAEVKSLSIANGYWQVNTEDKTFNSAKVVLATGSNAKQLNNFDLETIHLATALTPEKLQQTVTNNDSVAVFGSSHSAMIIIRNLIEAGVQSIYNFYLSPLRFAIPMEGWTLYDNSGLKGETAKWVHKNISQCCLPKIKRIISNEKNIQTHLPQCNKAVYAVGFSPRHVAMNDINLSDYDKSNGIIAPGLFGTGIAFPQETVDPFGNHELNVGLWKFLVDIKRVLPLWMQYAL